MKYKEKPVIIDAFQMTMERRQDNSEWPEWLNKAWQKDPNEGGSVSPKDWPHSNGEDKLSIRTPKGTMTVEWNDWIIMDVMGGIYPCKPDIFDKTYEAI